MLIWEAFWDVLQSWPSLRRTLFCLVVFVPLFLGWWHWSISAALAVTYLIYEAFDWLMLKITGRLRRKKV